MRFHGCHDVWNFCRESPAIGVAENEAFRTSCNGSIKASQGIFLVVFEAVKEMFCVIKKMLYMGSEISKGVFNNDQVIRKLYAQGIMDMNIPGFTKYCDTRGLCRNQG